MKKDQKTTFRIGAIILIKVIIKKAKHIDNLLNSTIKQFISILSLLACHIDISDKQLHTNKRSYVTR